MKHKILFLVFLILAVPTFALSSQKPANHQITVTVSPDKSAIEVHDSLTLHPDTTKDSITLYLHADYQLLSSEAQKSPGVKISPRKTPLSAHGVPIRQIDVSKSKNTSWPQDLVLKFHYKGRIHNPEKEAGIQLSGADYFYPQVADETPQLVTFTLTATAAGWTVVSQGKLDSHSNTQKSAPTVTWVSNEPQEEIFLIADRFEAYETTHGAVQIYAFLRDKNPDLANQYLKAAESYIDFYEKLLSPYPYAKFALVENARQTGYGMPSFTLLGSQVIRLPFILHTSYPHEILHNWWGNGVYIHPASGNWAEGLTSYLSDHLLAEMEGQGDKYRFQELMKYLNYAAKDFPLSEFKSRHDMASQAVGYGKWLMVLNMLRVELGDEVFLRSLREFYNTYKFRFAGYNELRASFEKASGKNLEYFFQQWVTKTGAPELELADADYDPNVLHLKIKQKQTAPFRLTLPIAVWFKNSELPQLSTLTMSESEQTFNLELPNEPAAVMIDPYYDVFRKLDWKEAPPSIGQTYGSEKIVTLVGENDPIDYRSFAQTLTGQAENNSRGQGDIPPDHSLWVFGKNNEMAGEVIAQLKQYGVEITEQEVILEGKPYQWDNKSFVFTVRNPKDPSSSVTWVVTDLPESIPGLIRKLPHYGKFGYMVFEGSQPTNILKGVWPAERAGLMKIFHQQRFSLPAKPPLVGFKPVP